MTKTEPRPLRRVVSASLRSGRGGILGPDTDRRVRWYELKLECGHEVERLAKYTKHPSHRRQRQRSYSDVLPPQKRARCEWCWSEGGTGR